MSTGDLISEALRLLRTADVRVGSSVGLDDLVLILPDRRTVRVRVKAFSAPPPPSAIDRLVSTQRKIDSGAQLLIVLPRSTPYLRMSAAAKVFHLVSVEERLVVIDGVDNPTGEDVETSPVTRSRGRRPWLRWAIERTLLLSTVPLPAKALSEQLYASPQSISKALKSHQYASRNEDGWTVENRDGLLNRFVDEYPGPGGVTTYWYGLDAPTQQIGQARKLSADMEVECLQTGDIAADYYAPWRLPVTGAIYLRELLDFIPADFTVASRSDHTLMATVPEDRTIWRTAAALAGPDAAFVDPIVALHDVMHGEGADAPEAADHLRDAILDYSLRTIA